MERKNALIEKTYFVFFISLKTIMFQKNSLNMVKKSSFDIYIYI